MTDIVEQLKYWAFKFCGKGIQENKASDAMTAGWEEIERLREALRKANERHNPARADVAPIRGTGEASLEEGSRGTGFSQRSGGYGKETI